MRGEKTLAAATTQEEVFAAVLGYMPAQVDDIALSDLPEEIKIAAEVAEAMKDVAADEGEEAPSAADAEPAAEMRSSCRKRSRIPPRQRVTPSSSWARHSPGL